MSASAAYFELSAPAGCRLVVAIEPSDASVQRAKLAARALHRRVEHDLDFAPAYVSRSGSSGVTACAVSESLPVGVDVERVDENAVSAELLELTLHPGEWATAPDDLPRCFFDLWTRKEAALKAIGTGLAVDPRSIQVGWGSEQWEQVSVPGQPAALVRSIGGFRTFRAAIAVWSTIGLAHCSRLGVPDSSGSVPRGVWRFAGS